MDHDVALRGGQSVAQIFALLLLGFGMPRANHRHFTLRQRPWLQGVENWCLLVLQHGSHVRQRERALRG